MRKRSASARISFLMLAFVALVLSAFATRQLINREPPCANSHTCRQPLTEQIDNTALGTFWGQTVIPPKISLAQTDESATKVLGDVDTQSAKHIYIDLDRQMLYAYEGYDLVQSALISSGRWGWTPVGNYNIQSKFKATRMSGGSGGDYYNLPNVPYTMFFNGDFGIHGAYWHNNFGTPMSHGCVNMRTADAKSLFEWADGPAKGAKGTAVSVCQSFVAPDGCVQDQKVHMPTPADLPPVFAQESLSRVSADGKKSVTVSTTSETNGTRTYRFAVVDTASGESTTVTTQTLDASLHVNVPYNAWSPNNSYFFVEHKTSDNTLVDVQVFKANEAYDSKKPLLSAMTAFELKQPNYQFDRATGWASNTLLIVNSVKPADQTKGPSFWYEVPSQAVMQLSQQF